MNGNGHMDISIDTCRWLHYLYTVELRIFSIVCFCIVATLQRRCPLGWWGGAVPPIILDLTICPAKQKHLLRFLAPLYPDAPDGSMLLLDDYIKNWTVINFFTVMCIIELLQTLFIKDHRTFQNQRVLHLRSQRKLTGCAYLTFVILLKWYN